MDKNKRINKTKFLLILVLILNILLRFPSLFDPVSYGDECIYLTLGNALKKGLVFYRDIHDNKPPLLYLMAALAGGKQFWLRLFMTLWNTVNVWLIYQVVKKLLKDEQSGVLAAFLFVIFALLPEGRIANGEVFMIMPATLGLLLTLVVLGRERRKKQKVFLWFLAGLSFSLAFLFKVPVVFDFLGLILAIFVFGKKKLKESYLVLKDKRFYLTMLGFILPIGLSIIYYASKGTFTPYFRSALLQNVGYLSSWGRSDLGLYYRALILFLVAALIFIWRQRLKPAFFFPALLTAFGLYGVFLSQRPYPHYLIEITPWAAILITVFLKQRKKLQLVIILLLVFLGLIGVNKYQYWWYPHLPYYKNFLSFAFKQISKKRFFSYFGSKVLNDYEVAKFLKTHTKDDERVFIWGDGACIYALSERLPPGRYTVNYHIYDFDGFEETLTAIEEKQPPIIVMLEPAKKDFPQLESLLSTVFIKTTQIGEAEIYQRLNIK